jgi:hypothetical protein
VTTGIATYVSSPTITTVTSAFAARGHPSLIGSTASTITVIRA